MDNVTWALFNVRTGARVTFLREYEPMDALLMAQLIDEELSSMIDSGLYAVNQVDTEPAQAKLAEEGGAERQQIIGYVLGRGNDTKLKRQMPRLYLYVDWRPYSPYTVFHEKLDTLPPDIVAEIADYRKAFDGNTKPELLPGALQAPEKTQAEAAGLFHPCNFEAIVEPELDRSGQPKKNSGGYVIHRYVSSVGAIAPAAPAATTATTNGNGKNHTEKLASRPTLNTLHALGTTYYGDGWDTKRLALVKNRGASRDPAVEISSSNDLYQSEAEMLCAGIEKMTRTQIEKLWQEMKLPARERKDLVAGATEQRYTDLEAVGGVLLTRVAGATEALYSTYLLEQQTNLADAEEIPF